MRKLVFNVGLFLMGVFMAAVVVYASRGDRRVAQDLGRAKMSPPKTQVLHLTNDEEDALRKTLPLGKGLQRLIDALEDGSPESLRFVRSDFLQGITNYHNVILPPLRAHAIQSLVRRMTVDDWQSWPKSRFALAGRPSMARQYVDDVMSLNADLGVFLETGALLLHGLYVNTRVGRPYNLEQGMDYILENAEQLMPNRTNTAIPGRMLLSPSAIIDPAFVATFEEERGRLTAAYIQQRPAELLLHLDLIKTLDPRYTGPNVSREVVNVMRRLRKEASERLRLRTLEDEDQMSIISRLALNDERVSRELAELYVVAAVDSLEARQLERARAFLRSSVQQAPNLPAQKQVREFFRSLGLAVETKATVAEPASPLEQAKSGSGYLRYIIYGAAAILLLAAGGWFISFLSRIRQEPLIDEFEAEGDPTLETYHDWKLGGTASELIAPVPSDKVDSQRKVANSPR